MGVSVREEEEEERMGYSSCVTHEKKVDSAGPGGTRGVEWPCCMAGCICVVVARCATSSSGSGSKVNGALPPKNKEQAAVCVG